MSSRPLMSEYARVASEEPDSPAEDSDEHPVEFSLTDIAPLSKDGRRWSLIKDLDKFFQSVYYFWLAKGFTCLAVEEVLGLGQFVFVVFLAILLVLGIDYNRLMVAVPARNISLHALVNNIKQEILGRNTSVVLTNTSAFDIQINGDGARELHVRSLVSFEHFLAGEVHWIWYFLLVCASIFWLHRLCRVIYRLREMWGIRAFYKEALGVNPSEMENYTWQEIQDLVIQAQTRLHMCVHKAKLTELDLCNRILRQKNFMLAMINKGQIQTQFNVPLWGRRTFFTEELKYLYEMILFWGPGSPFSDRATLHNSFKKGDKAELAQRLQRNISYYALVSLLLSPLIFIWQVFYSTFTAVELTERKKGALGLRRWSPLARQQLRNYNELDHNFQFRLNVAYTPAEKYVKSFMSPLLAILARHVAFICAALLFVTVAFAMVDETLLIANNVPLTIAGLGVVLGVCRSLIPDEDEPHCPKQLMEDVVKFTYYGPVEDWKGQEHTIRVREAFTMQFQYRLNFWIEQILSPLIVPFILYFHLRPKAHDIVNFLRSFTVTVDGVGDVCSFAQLNVSKHGNPKWSSERCKATQVEQSEDGKTEMSVVAFMINNPRWDPPKESRQFLTDLRESAGEDALRASGMGSVHATAAAVDPQASLLPSMVSGGWTTYPALTSLMQSSSQAALAFQSLAVVENTPPNQDGDRPPAPLLQQQSEEGTPEKHAGVPRQFSQTGISSQPSAASLYPPLSSLVPGDMVGGWRRPLTHQQQLESIGHAALYLQESHRRRLGGFPSSSQYGQNNV